MTEQTCGKGLAEYSTLPARMGAIASAMAEVLAHHQRSLDPKDAEYDAYGGLVHDFRALGVSLDAVAKKMAGYRDLPMADHDISVLASPESARTFAAFVDAERALLALLQTSTERDESMLATMR